MNEVVTIKYSGKLYTASKRFAEFKQPEAIKVMARMPSGATHVAYCNDEELARRWLSDRGLRKSKAKKLLAAALRNEGDFADPQQDAGSCGDVVTLPAAMLHPNA